MMPAYLGYQLVETRAVLSGQVAIGAAREWLEWLGVGVKSPLDLPFEKGGSQNPEADPLRWAAAPLLFRRRSWG